MPFTANSINQLHFKIQADIQKAFHSELLDRHAALTTIVNTFLNNKQNLNTGFEGFADYFAKNKKMPNYIKQVSGLDASDTTALAYLAKVFILHNLYKILDNNERKGQQLMFKTQFEELRKIWKNQICAAEKGLPVNRHRLFYRCRRMSVLDYNQLQAKQPKDGLELFNRATDHGSRAMDQSKGLILAFILLFLAQLIFTLAFSDMKEMAKPILTNCVVGLIVCFGFALKGMFDFAKTLFDMGLYKYAIIQRTSEEIIPSPQNCLGIKDDTEFLQLIGNNQTNNNDISLSSSQINNSNYNELFSLNYSTS